LWGLSRNPEPRVYLLQRSGREIHGPLSKLQKTELRPTSRLAGGDYVRRFRARVLARPIEWSEAVTTVRTSTQLAALKRCTRRGFAEGSSVIARASPAAEKPRS